MENRRIILASGSPRRRELLARAGYEFEVITSHAEEVNTDALEPHELAMENARAKALAVARMLAEADEDARAEPGAGAAAGTAPLVIGADTIVVLDGHVFGKPADERQAAATLRALSGRAHQVITGVCVVEAGDVRGRAGELATRATAARVFAETTQVVFRQLGDAEISAYISTGEPMDKAGAYGIQGKGGALVERIEGDYDNVVGLPVARLVRELEQMGIRRPDAN